MKTKKVLLSVVLASFFLLFGCSKDDDYEQDLAMTSQGSSLSNSESISQSSSTTKSSSTSLKSAAISNEYTQAKQEVLETFGAIAKSITDGAGKGYNSEYMDQLISFHAYGDKFVEFNGGEVFDSKGNEHNERQLFGVDLEEGGVIQFAPKEGTLKVAVYYGNVANLTFVSDFILRHKDYGEITINNLITLLFVKINGEWKMVHEHHSPVAP